MLPDLLLDKFLPVVPHLLESRVPGRYDVLLGLDLHQPHPVPLLHLQLDILVASLGDQFRVFLTLFLLGLELAVLGLDDLLLQVLDVLRSLLAVRLELAVVKCQIILVEVVHA